MATQRPLAIYSSYIAAQLLQSALHQYGVAEKHYEILTPPPKNEPAPLALLIQPGGLLALQQIGYSADTLYAAGQPVHGLNVFDNHGRSKWRIDISAIADTPPALAIESQRLHSLLTKAHSFAQFERSPAYENVIGHPCTPITLQLLAGRLHYDVGMIHDIDEGHVGIVNVSDDLVLSYFITKARAAAPDAAASAVAALQRSFYGIIDVRLPALQYQSFDLERIGIRRSLEHEHLLWGGLAMQMHPLTGQAISYWAQQAVWLAERLAAGHGGHGSIQAESHANNLRMYKSHKHIVDYYLRPSLFWKALHVPYSFSLRYVPYVKRRAMRQLALI